MKKLLLIIWLLPAIVCAQNKRADSLMRVIELSKSDTEKANAYNALGRMAADKRDSLHVAQYANAALLLADKSGFTKGRIRALYNFADLYSNRTENKKAIEYYLQGIRLAVSKHLQREMANGYHNCALSLKDLGDNRKSLLYNDSALTVYKVLRDSDKMAVIYTNMGNNYKNLDQFDSAIHYQLRSLQYFQRKKDNLGIGRAYNNIGIIYMVMRSDSMAMIQFQKIVPLAIEIKDTVLLAKSYQNIGASYMNLAKHEKALEYLRPAFDMQMRLGIKRSAIITLSNIAACLANKKDYKEAVKVGEQAVKLCKETDDEVSLAYSYKNLAIALRGLEDDRGCEKYLKMALEIALKNGETDLFRNIYEELANVYTSLGNYKKALEYTKLADKLKDSISSVERGETIADLQTKYETQKKESELAEIRAVNVRNEMSLQRKNGLLLLTVCTAGFLIISLVLVFRNSKLQRNKLKKEAELNLQIAAIEAHNNMQEEKLRISGELHDNIGSQLTFIHSSLSAIEPAEEGSIDEMRKMTLNTMRELRRTVWLINKDKFLLQEFTIKVKEYLSQLHTGRPEIEVQVTGGREETELSATIATNLFRIIQEAVNNAIKYAAASKLLVVIDSRDENYLKVAITDNGSGFEETDRENGFGLKNIKVRTKKINGDLTIETGINKGTSIRINVPLL